MNDSFFPPYSRPSPSHRESWPHVVRVAEGDGQTLYGFQVNALTAFAEVGEETWLATLMGIKRVSKNPVTPTRHYTLQDGLPGMKTTAIAADEHGIYALIDLEEWQEALCALNTASDTWSTLARWPRSGDPVHGGFQRGLLALAKDVVVATPGVVYPGIEPILQCFTRSGHEPIAIPWDSAVRPDKASIALNFLACREDVIALGTSIGWIELPAPTRVGPWIYRLTDRHICHGAESGGQLYLWMGEYAPEHYFQQPKEIERIDTATWQGTPLPKIALPVPFAPSAVDESGDLWFVMRVPQHYSMDIPGPGQVALYHWSLAEERWEELTNEGHTLEPGSESSSAVSSEAIVPDAAARLLTLVTQQYGPDSRALRWLRRRFPHWLSPDASAEMPPLLQASFTRCPAIVEPGAPEHAWAGVRGALMRLPTDTLPAAPMPPEGAVNPNTGARVIDHPTQEHALVPDVPVPLSVSFRQILSLPDGRFFVMGDLAMIASEQGRHWETLGSKSQYGQMDIAFFAEDQKTILIHASISPNLQRVDIESGEVVVTDIPSPGDLFLGANAQGAWGQKPYPKRRRGFNPEELHVVEWGNIQSHEISPPFPENFRPSQMLGISGGRLWWSGHDPSHGFQPLLYGWDSVENRWSPALALPKGFSNTLPVSDNQGSFYIVSRNNFLQLFQLFHWKEGEDSWKQLPLATFTGSELTLLAVDDAALYLTDSRSLICVVQGTDTIEYSPLPCQTTRGQKHFSVTPDAIFLAANYSLYRFDRVRFTWEQWRPTVPAPTLFPDVRAADDQFIWGELSTEQNVSSVLFRFDPASRQIDLFGEESGLPAFYHAAIIINKSEPWVRCGGVYRFDSATQRFTLELAMSVKALAPSDSGDEMWFVGQPAFGESYLYRWQRGGEKMALISDSSWNNCYDVMCCQGDIFIATDTGLRKQDAHDNWIAVESFGVVPRNLHKGDDGSLWFSGDRGIVHLHAQIEANSK